MKRLVYPLGPPPQPYLARMGPRAYIITDQNGKATIKFFNADGTGNYKVIAEGLDRQGNLGRQLYRYIVK